MIREGKKLPENSLRRVPEIIKAVSKENDILALYGFGSAFQGTLSPLSDLDFAVLLSNHLDNGARFKKQLQLIGLFNDIFRSDEIDLVVLNDAPLRFCFNILKTGKMLFCPEKSKIIEFQERVIKLYLDFRYFRDSFDETFLKGVGYHG
jgi:predicted nucleotidyltransferase